MVKLTPLMGGRKIVDITYQTPQETLLGTPETLPTTEPATPQIAYTVAAGDLPAFSTALYSQKYIGVVFSGGKFVTAGTLSWRMKKNGASVATGTAAVAANTFFTVNAWFFDAAGNVGVAVGDVLEIALWSNQTDSNWDYKAFWVNFTRPFLVNPLSSGSPLSAKQIVVQLSITSPATSYPTLTLGNPSKAVSNYLCKAYTESGLNAPQLGTGNNTWATWWHPQHLTFGIYRYMYYGDDSAANTATVNTDATYRPKHWANWMITSIKGRGFRAW